MTAMGLAVCLFNSLLTSLRQLHTAVHLLPLVIFYVFRWVILKSIKIFTFNNYILVIVNFNRYWWDFDTFELMFYSIDFPV